MDQMANLNESVTLMPDAADFGNHSISTMRPPIDPALVRFRDDSRFWVQRVLTPIVATIGVFGNIATIYVLTRRGMRSSTNAYLTALAIADLLYLLCVFWLSLRHYPFLKETPFLDNFFSYVFPYSLWLTDAATNTSVWLTVTFTVERYIAVCHPIRGRLLCTESRAKKVIVAVYLACFIAPITTPFEYSVQEVNDTKTNTTKVVVGYSSLGEDETYQTVFYWFTSITFVLLPLALLIIFNSFLIQSVRRSKKLRQAMTQCQGVRSDREERAASNEIRITVTLIAVVMMFLVCQSPTAATLIYKIFNQPEPNTDADTLLRALGNIFNFLVAFNASCNFLLYCALSDKYRRTFVLTFCRCFYRPASPVHSMAFFTATDQDQTSSNHSRQPSVRVGVDRYARPSLHAGQQRGANGNRANRRSSSSYLALPDGNGSVASRSGDSKTSSREGRISPRSSFQSNSSVRTAVVSNKTPSQRWTKWWKPWASSRSPSSAQKRAPNKPSSILIQISDVEEAGQDREVREMARNGVPDEAVAFV